MPPIYHTTSVGCIDFETQTMKLACTDVLEIVQERKLGLKA